jgi:predicted metal-dependent HD superfamily phosphohydrolase
MTTQINEIRNNIISMLKEGLSPQLTYHCLEHTLDVSEQSVLIAIGEGITDVQTLKEIEIASLYHDIGFIFTYINHEEKSCEIARKQLPNFGLTEIEIENICQLIMATKVPQIAKNHLQKIICDADLDYLGRDDFFEISNKLKTELLTYKFISDENDWKEKQQNFLLSHQYFTETSRLKREPKKQQHINQLKSTK